ncbi:glycoside hydrolase family 3 C-terminal domain-containing protein [Actinomadura sp. ATCC 31491]|uniref:Glycoside hydrolase family 3 C-terminal domain-containing protein n=1 Tax=Actinomadura luzonensis TaxID=2805427 RepID=A0ABT0G7N9_9ACTN|nr:glycoside hydrolase family 3 C-terminal domain-containing protein [Actinomadura luzonensis]MCK2220611.1 glycoside hydrolase family 3 C-terminal domain-containing protein [Actinomadura luzonensis]
MKTVGVDFDVLVASLDLTAKIRLLTGADMWSLPPMPRIGLDRLVMSDGPIGVRGEQWSPGDPSIALPSPTALAATWDLDLVRRAGRLLAQEARRKGVHVLLAPTLNLHRSPLGGRHFECYSEDPYLTGEIGAAYVEGVQEGGVATTPKHFVANDFETDRFTADVRVGEKALREVYLRPFERVVRAGAWGLMTAYNAVNGTTMTEHAELVNGVLKDEWGFDGLVVSDWTAVRSTEAAALGGTDVAMPGPYGPWGDKLEAAVREGRVPEAAIDDRVRRVLRLAHRVGALRPPAGSSSAASSPAGSSSPAASSSAAAAEAAPAREEIDGVALAREVAVRGCTLLTNDGLLPLREGVTLAVIGAAAGEARIMGGGSAQVFPDRVVSPLAGLRARAEVRHALGTDPRVRLSPISSPARAEFLDADGGVLAAHPLPVAEARWIGQLPRDVDGERLRAVRLRTTYTPEVSGEHVLSVAGVGAFTMSVDGEVVLDATVEAPGGDPAAAFLSPPEQRVSVPMAAGRPYELCVTHPSGVFGGMAFVAFTLGHAAPGPGEDELLAEAVRVAAACDVAVVVAATTPEVESEGFDRVTLALPGRQDELIRAVIAANPRTVVVVNAGSPVELPWAADAAAVLLTWFPGQEAGTALADVLFGDAEPGGRLPTTWPRRLADAPVTAVTPVDGVLAYDEGVRIGYRAWRRAGAEPAFWFGHGLGYTTWSYDQVAAEGTTVTVAVTNTGDRPGREVVQLYARPAGGDDVRLAGFDVVEADPGQTVLATVFLDERAFQEWQDGGWRPIEGEHVVTAGRGVTGPGPSVTVRIPPTAK